MEILNTLYVKNRDEWRAWLEENYNTQSEVWLIYYKKHSGKPRIPYEDAVEEALCFGWIDSTVKKIDEEKYAQKFTPRRDKSRWSALNKKRVAKLIKEGRMTEHGLAKVNYPATGDEKSPGQEQNENTLVLPDYIKQAFKTDKNVLENFEKLAPSHKKNYIRWITAAKKEETRTRRLKEAMELLAQNKKLGLK